RSSTRTGVAGNRSPASSRRERLLPRQARPAPPPARLGRPRTPPRARAPADPAPGDRPFDAPRSLQLPRLPLLGGAAGAPPPRRDVRQDGAAERRRRASRSVRRLAPLPPRPRDPELRRVPDLDRRHRALLARRRGSRLRRDVRAPVRERDGRAPADPLLRLRA